MPPALASSAHCVAQASRQYTACFQALGMPDRQTACGRAREWGGVRTKIARITAATVLPFHSNGVSGPGPSNCSLRIKVDSLQGTARAHCRSEAGLEGAADKGCLC